MALATRSVRRTASARDDGYNSPLCLYQNVTYASPNLQTTAGKIVYVGVLPANCCPLDTVVRINTTFNGLLIVGTSGNTSALVSTADVAAGTANTYVVDRYFGTRSTLDVPVYVQLTTASTVGEADIWVHYLPAR